METKEVKVEIPEGYEVDKENSSFEEPINIVFKKTEVKTWDDLIKIKHIVRGYYINTWNSKVASDLSEFPAHKCDKCNFIDAKHAKSALAMAQISQLMPYYGGAITDKEWTNSDEEKSIIKKVENKIYFDTCEVTYYLLAFHTEEQCRLFYKNNEQLVEDYLMIVD